MHTGKKSEVSEPLMCLGFRFVPSPGTCARCAGVLVEVGCRDEH